MKQKFEGFLKSKAYLIIISLITFLTWFFNFGSVGPRPEFDLLEIIMIGAFASFIALILICFKETIYTFPLIPHAIIMLSNQNMGMSTLNAFWPLYVVIGIVVLAFIFHLIYYRVRFSFGQLGIGLLIFAGAYILSLFGYLMNQKPFELSVLTISMMGLLYFFIYIFYQSTNETISLDYIFTSLTFLSVVIMFQALTKMIIFFIDNSHLGSFSDILNHAMEHRWIYLNFGLEDRLNVGWGLGNNIAGVLVMLLPLYLYFLFKQHRIKLKIVYLSLMVLSGIVILLTTSRGAYLGGLAFSVLFVFSLFKYGRLDFKQYKRQFLIGGIILLILLIPVIYFLYGFMASFLTNNEFLNGRQEDWSDALKYFSESPFFGKSWYSDAWDVDQDSFRSYHNTILHTMATMGLIGLGALIYHHFELVRLFIKKWSFKVFIVVSMFIIMHVHGLVDNTYYAPIHIFIMLLTFIGIEKEKESRMTA